MVRKLLAGLLSALLLFSNFPATSLAVTPSLLVPSTPKIMINGQLISFSIPPIAKKENTLVPLKEVCARLKIAVKQDNVLGTVKLSKGNTTLLLRLYAPTGLVNNRRVKLPLPLEVKSGQVLVPVKLLADTFRIRLSQDSTKQVSLLYTTPADSSLPVPLEEHNWHPLFTGTYNSFLAYWSAFATQDTYGSYGNDASLKKLGFVSTHVYQSRGVYTVVGFKKLAGSGKRIIAIVFRGSQNLTADWINTDLDFTPVAFKPGDYTASQGYRVHQGYYKAEQSFESNLEQRITLPDLDKKLSTVQKKDPGLLAKINSNYIFWISGHSSGGAMAAMYTMSLIERGVKPENIITYTFGAPPFANVQTVSLAAKLKASPRIFRLVNLDDPFATSTLFAFNFLHLPASAHTFPTGQHLIDNGRGQGYGINIRKEIQGTMP